MNLKLAPLSLGEVRGLLDGGAVCGACPDEHPDAKARKQTRQTTAAASAAL